MIDFAFNKFKAYKENVSPFYNSKYILDVATSEYDTKTISRNKISKDYNYVIYKLEKAKKSYDELLLLCRANKQIKKIKNDKIYYQWELSDQYENFLASIVSIHDFVFNYDFKDKESSDTLYGFFTKGKDKNKINFLKRFLKEKDLKLCKATRNYFFHEGYICPLAYSSSPLFNEIAENNRKFTIKNKKYSIIKFSKNIYNDTALLIINLIRLKILQGYYKK